MSGPCSHTKPERWRVPRAVLFPSVFEPGYAARYTHGQVTLRARAFYDVARTIEVHIGSGRERCLLAKVEKRLAAIGQLDGHEAPAAQIACGGVDHGHCITHGNRRIDRRGHFAMGFGAERG